MYSFQDWVEDVGGHNAVAELLGVHRKTVSTWYNRHAYPNVLCVMEIRRLSRGKLTYEAILSTTGPEKGTWKGRDLYV